MSKITLPTTRDEKTPFIDVLIPFVLACYDADAKKGLNVQQWEAGLAAFTNAPVEDNAALINLLNMCGITSDAKLMKFLSAAEREEGIPQRWVNKRPGAARASMLA